MGMKFRVTTYSFTLCLVCAAIIFAYLDLRVLPNRPDESLVTEFKVNQLKAEEDEASFTNLSELQDYSPKPVVYKLQARQKDASETTVSTTEPTTLTSYSPKPLSTAHIIAVISYMRSGSSFTADIMQHFPRTVYVFEPLHTVQRRAIEGKPLIYLNGRRAWIKPENLTDQFLTTELHKWFQCRYNDLDIHSLIDGFHLQFSRSMRLLVMCWKKKRKSIKSMRLCLPAAIKMCQNAKQRLFKFIRLPMRVIQSVFDLYPKLQIIHLIRDPRGALTSQISVKRFTWEDVDRASKIHCDKVSEDLNGTVWLNYRDNNRARILMYESLAENPINVAERIYRYIGMPIMKQVLNYVRKITLDGRKKSCSFCIVRGNSTETAYSWREKIKYQDVKTIDSNCPIVYDYMGYQTFSSPADLVDLSIATHRSPNRPIII